MLTRRCWPAESGDPTVDTDIALCLIEAGTGMPVARHTLILFGGEPCDGAPCRQALPRGFECERKLSGGTIRVKSLRGGNRILWNRSWQAPLTMRLIRSDAPECRDATFDELVRRGTAQTGAMP